MLEVTGYYNASVWLKNEHTITTTQSKNTKALGAPVLIPFTHLDQLKIDFSV